MKRQHQPRPVRVGLISLGCAKNLVDSEIMLGSLLQAGFELINDAAAADAIIVNTCSFIDAAQEESVDTILESAELRAQRRPEQALIVSGCLSQRFREELPKLLPEVDAFMGIDQVRQVSGVVADAIQRRAEKLRDGPAEAPRTTRRATRRSGERLLQPPVSATRDPVFSIQPRPTYIPDYATPRFRLTPRHFAYVKIAEGCNHPCSFCIIPQMRGSHRSRPQHDVVEECRRLVAEGVKELNLISQDTTYYGLDLRTGHSRAIASPERFRAAARALPAGATTLCTLLRALNEIPGEFWIRLLYTHPAHWTEELIQTLADCPKVARYVDIPLQHIHEVMLERMRRETSREFIEKLIARLRAALPGITLRTTFIVGFPGETEAYFKSLLEFIRATRFERLGVFTYSREQGTRAAGMTGQVPERLRHERRARAMAEQQRLARERAHSFLGRELKVLVETQTDARQLQPANVVSAEHGLVREPDTIKLSVTATHGRKRSNRVFVARSEADAPEIDGRVLVRGRVGPGDFARVRVIGHTDYDLIAEPVEF